MNWLLRAIVLCFVGASICAAPHAGVAIQASEVESPDFTQDADQDSDEKEYRVVSVRGQVAFLGEVLERRFGVKTVPEARERVLVLQSADGKLMPIVEDLRGRSFRKDVRLRQTEVDLDARQYDGSQLIQVLRIHEIKDGRKFVVDYWCDVCAIVMYEDGPCACCQDDNRLRKRPVETTQ